MALKKRLLVLCGGRSAEHQVSLVSAKMVLAQLDRRRFDVELVFIDARGRWLAADAKRLTGRIGADVRALTSGARALSAQDRLAPAGRRCDVVFPVLHGPLGEDGTVQGLLELADVPYVGCGVLGSAVGMDKEYTKRLAVLAGLPVLPYAAIRRPKQAAAAARSLGLPLFVKPARLGSSVGISKVKKLAELPAAVAEAFRYDDKVVLEKGITAREIECAVLGDPWASDPEDPLRLRASICGEIVPNAEFYTYESKYLDPDGARLCIPADITKAQSKNVRELSLAAFRALDGYGLARVDFLMDKASGKVWFNELNTLPGFTPASMYAALESLGASHPRTAQPPRGAGPATPRGTLAPEVGALKGSGRALAAAPWLFAASGFAGLLYETVWTRQLVLVFGATVPSASTVLAGFMAGFALGGFWGGRWASRTRSPLRLYGRLELGVAAAAALFPLALQLLLWSVEHTSLPEGPPLPADSPRFSQPRP